MKRYLVQKEMDPLAVVWETDSTGKQGSDKLIMAFRVQDASDVRQLFQHGGVYLNRDYLQFFDKNKSLLTVFDCISKEEVMCHKINANKLVTALRSFESTLSHLAHCEAY